VLDQGGYEGIEIFSLGNDTLNYSSNYQIIEIMWINVVS
jgi:hypothetical protein